MVDEEESMETQAQRHLESWINGNRKHVVGDLFTLTSNNTRSGMYATALLVGLLNEDERLVFLKLLNNKRDT